MVEVEVAVGGTGLGECFLVLFCYPQFVVEVLLGYVGRCHCLPDTSAAVVVAWWRPHLGQWQGIGRAFFCSNNQ